MTLTTAKNDVKAAEYAENITRPAKKIVIKAIRVEIRFGSHSVPE